MTSGRRDADRKRAYFALVACLLWLVGFEALPTLHVAMHAKLGAHRHEGALIIPIADPSATDDRDVQVDEHGDPIAAAGDPAEADVPAPPHHHAADAHARLARALGHGHGSLAHHDLAVKAPAIPLHAPLPVDRRPSSLEGIAIATPISARAPRASARGPPSA